VQRQAAYPMARIGDGDRLNVAERERRIPWIARLAGDRDRGGCDRGPGVAMGRRARSSERAWVACSCRTTAGNQQQRDDCGRAFHSRYDALLPTTVALVEPPKRAE
jgi:hypothetical protein